jgi:hypothetical protein
MRSVRADHRSPESGQQVADGNFGFELRELGAEAEVVALAEGQVAIVGAPDVETL